MLDTARIRKLFDEETRKVLKRRDVIFDETVFVFNKPVTEQKNTIFDVGSRGPPVRFGVDEFANTTEAESDQGTRRKKEIT